MGGGMLGVGVAQVLADRGGEVIVVAPGGKLAAELGGEAALASVLMSRSPPC